METTQLTIVLWISVALYSLLLINEAQLFSSFGSKKRENYELYYYYFLFWQQTHSRNYLVRTW